MAGYPQVTAAIAFAFGAANPPGAAALTLLSDLPTPSFVIDLRALQRSAGTASAGGGTAAGSLPPPLRSPRHGLTLCPFPLAGGPSKYQQPPPPPPPLDVDFSHAPSDPAVAYLHTSVVRSRADPAGCASDGPGFLAELDLLPSLCGGGGARVVLGLNNHHVGGYYCEFDWDVGSERCLNYRSSVFSFPHPTPFPPPPIDVKKNQSLPPNPAGARSSGAGQSMDAIGVAFGPASDPVPDPDPDARGVLRWDGATGNPADCNSNDGKRSEWCNFLRRGDTVQLVPGDGQDSLLAFAERYGGGEEDDGCVRAYGVTSEGRPLGSEPAVLCEFRAVASKGEGEEL